MSTDRTEDSVATEADAVMDVDAATEADATTAAVALGIATADALAASGADAPTGAIDPDAGLRPRIRVGALIWALIAAAVAAGLLVTAAVPERRDDLLAAVLDATPLTATIALVLLFGAIALLLAVTALLRHAQRAATRRRA